MRAALANIYRLGIKELWSLVRDPIMLVLIVYTFSVSIYVAATAMPERVCVCSTQVTSLRARWIAPWMT